MRRFSGSRVNDAWCRSHSTILRYLISWTPSTVPIGDEATTYQFSSRFANGVIHDRIEETTTKRIFNR